MGMVDSFHDGDSKCPKCKAPVSDWQTKRLQRLGEHWKKGDFLQYRKWKPLSERERKRIKKDGIFAPLFRTSREYLSDAPLFLNGKVPVHMNCDKCNAWLEAYAKILDGKFVGIVEAESGVKEKEMILFKPETSAQSLREDFNKRLSHLQESCKHQKKQWMDIEWAPSHFAGKALVCQRCEKVLERKGGTVRRTGKVGRTAGSKGVF